MTQYDVRLLMGLEADNSRQAMHGFIETIVSTGMRTFIYRVDNRETGEVEYVSGEGTVYDEDTLREFLAGYTGDYEGDYDPDEELADPVGSDLLTEAERLSNELI